ncbi:MAG: pyruvate, water dikinase regulatory protein [Hyphomicrobium sp.]
MTPVSPSLFHMHLVSDATGETLAAIAKAAAVQYPRVRPIEHMHPLVRTQRQLKRVLAEIEKAPGIVLYTVVNKALGTELEQHCKQLAIPCLAVLQPIMQIFESYLGAPQTPTVAGQHVLDADYFRRIDAMNFTLAHDDGRLPTNLSDADILVLGISRTSKTPTSIYLALRGFKTANLPLVPSVALPPALTEPHTAFIVCLIANAERVAEVRRNRAALLGDRDLNNYLDRDAIAAEIAYTRKIAAKNGWPIIDVTRRSIEESATMILKLLHDRKAGVPSEAEPGNA